MIKLSAIILPRRMKGFGFSLVCSILSAGNINAASIPFNLKNVTATDYTLDVTSTFSKTTGVFEKNVSYSSFGSFLWEGNNALGSRKFFYVGPQAFRANFNNSIIDVNKKTSYAGRNYYQLKIDSGAVALYVSVKQNIYDNEADVMQSYDVPFTAHNYSRTDVQYVPVQQVAQRCFISSTNTNDSVTCNGTVVSLSQSSTVSGRSGVIYFYMPKLPTHTIELNNLLIATTDVSSAYSVDSWAAARDDALAAVNSGSGSRVFSFFITGTLRFDNTCKISGPVAIEIPLGSLSTGSFTTKGGKPTSYSPKRTDLTFTCTKDIPSSYGGMKWSITPTAESSGSSLPGVLVAKPTAGNTVNGVGVKVTSDVNGNTPITMGASNLQTAAISGKNATATFYSYPTMTTDNKPTGTGDYTATATVMFEVP